VYPNAGAFRIPFLRSTVAERWLLWRRRGPWGDFFLKHRLESFATMINGDKAGGIANIGERIAIENEEVRTFSGPQRAAVLKVAEHFGGIAGRTLDCLHRAQAGLDQKLQLAVLGPARKPGGRRSTISAEADEHACVMECLHVFLRPWASAALFSFVSGLRVILEAYSGVSQDARNIRLDSRAKSRGLHPNWTLGVDELRLIQRERSNVTGAVPFHQLDEFLICWLVAHAERHDIVSGSEQGFRILQVENVRRDSKPVFMASSMIAV
jgi:hypothetical protein